MTILAQHLSRACDAIGLQIDLDYAARLKDGKEIQSIARIRNLGAEKGMLVFLDFDAVRDYVDQLDEAGYGFSVLSEHRSENDFDLEATLDMFRDWGWSGPANDTPASFR